jgi:hypothetical protein
MDKRDIYYHAFAVSLVRDMTKPQRDKLATFMASVSKRPTDPLLLAEVENSQVAKNTRLVGILCILSGDTG